METIKDIAKKAEIIKLKEEYNKHKLLFLMISEYIIKKKLLLYGGLATNLILSKKNRFYKDYTLYDFDCYSKYALKDTMELAKFLKAKGFNFIKIRRAKHKDTYRIFVYNKQVIDITQLNENIYDKLIKISIAEKEKSKFYKGKYILIPITLIKRNMHFELSRSKQSIFRWEKIFDRYKLLSNTYYNNRSKIKYECVPILDEYTEVFSKILNYVKEGEYPIIDSYAFKYYKKLNSNICCCRVSKGSKMLMIISDNYVKTKNEVVSLIKSIINDKKYDIKIKFDNSNTDILNANYCIGIKRKKEIDNIFNIITIIDNDYNCFSIKKINGYTIGSLDTILFFLYSYYIIYQMNNDKIHMEEYLYHINIFEDYIKGPLKNDLKKRIGIKCYGNIMNVEEYEKNWKNKSTIAYI